MSPEEEERMLLGQAKTVDSAAVTKDVLKSCGVTRDKMYLDRDFLKANTGLGGGDKSFYRTKIQKPQTYESLKKNSNAVGPTHYTQTTFQSNPNLLVNPSRGRVVSSPKSRQGMTA
jgi:hypothetical protein